MYDLQETASRIKQQAKAKKVAIKEVLTSCGLGINAISEMAKGKAMSSIKLALIADHLDCSVDYLLGRTDEPALPRPKNPGIKISATTVAGKSATLNATLSDDEAELLAIFARLDKKGKRAVLHEADVQDDRVKQEGDKAATTA